MTTREITTKAEVKSIERSEQEQKQIKREREDQIEYDRVLEQRNDPLSKAFKKLRSNQERFFVGKVIEDIEGTDDVIVITNYNRKIINGGLNRGKYLVMMPIGLHGINCIPYFILLRKTERADTPTALLERVKVYGYLQSEQSVTDDNILTGDVNHSAFRCSMIGEYAIVDDTNKIVFKRSLSDMQNGIHYDVYTPNEEMQNIIINSHITQEQESYFRVGKLRLSENESRVKGYEEINTPIYVKHNDILAKRTGILGKTRMGKSNFAKIFAINMNRQCGQLIFDIENEYGDTSIQDGVCLAQIVPDGVLFGFTKNKEGRESILYNFYEEPQLGMAVLGNMLRSKSRGADYAAAMLSVYMPTINEWKECVDPGDQNMFERRIKIFWAILYKAGFDYGDVSDFQRLSKNQSKKDIGILSPGIRSDIRLAAYNKDVPGEEGRFTKNTLPVIDDFDKLITELKNVYYYWKDLSIEEQSKGGRVFDEDCVSLLKFLFAGQGRSGTEKLKPYRDYHDIEGIGTRKLIECLEDKRTCIVNFNDEESDEVVQKYYTQLVTREVYDHQRKIFNRKDKDPHNILIYYEEAHTLFPAKEKWKRDGEQTVYTDIAKRGAKYGIGMVYITQSVTDLDEELLRQTENIFVLYLSDAEEAGALSKRNTNFKEHEYDITRAQTVGYGRMLTLSNRFVVPVQADMFDDTNRLRLEQEGKRKGGE